MRKFLRDALVLSVLCMLVTTNTYASSFEDYISTTGESTVTNDEDETLYNTSDIPWSYQGETNVEYEQEAIDAEITVVIPKSIALSKQKEATYSITVLGTAEQGVSVTCKPHDDVEDVDGINFIMSTSNALKDDVIATVVQEDTIWQSNEITEAVVSKVGTITAEGLSRGDWSGILTFDINLSDEDIVSTILPDSIELQDWNYELDSDNSVIYLTKYTGTDEDVTVRSSYVKDGAKYNTVLKANTAPYPTSTNIFSSNTSIRSVTIEDGVAAKDSLKFAFYRCTNLESITFPENFDMSLVTSTTQMFDGCTSLTSLDIANLDTSNVTDLGSMFANCSSLNTLDITTLDLSSARTIQGLFSGCSSLHTLDFSNFDTSTVRNMSRMFENCSSLSELDLSNFDTSNVTSMSDMFAGCSSLIELDLSNFNTSNVDTVSNMFYHCSSLVSLNISNFDTSGVKDYGVNGETGMYGMFCGLSSMKELDLRSFNTEKVKNMKLMFAECPELNAVYVDCCKWSMANVTNTTNMFQNCGVSELTIVHDYVDGVCSNCGDYLPGDEVKLSYWNYELDEANNEVNLICYTGTESDVTVYSAYEKDGVIYSTVLADHESDSPSGGPFLFNGNKSIKTVTFQNGVKAVGPSESWMVGSLYAAFANCTNLCYVDFGDLDTSDVTDMSYMFYGCSSLQHVYVKSGKWVTADRAAGMFQNCSISDIIYI